MRRVGTSFAVCLWKGDQTFPQVRIIWECVFYVGDYCKLTPIPHCRKSGGGEAKADLHWMSLKCSDDVSRCGITRGPLQCHSDLWTAELSVCGDQQRLSTFVGWDIHNYTRPHNLTSAVKFTYFQCVWLCTIKRRSKDQVTPCRVTCRNTI